MCHACPKEIQNTNIMGCCTCFCAKLSKKSKFGGCFSQYFEFFDKIHHFSQSNTEHKIRPKHVLYGTITGRLAIEELNGLTGYTK